MKKLLICLLLVCLIATNFAACTKQGSASDFNTENGTSENTHTDPPRMLDFSSLEEIIELKGVLEKNDEEVTEYLAEESFDMKGINSKKDIESFFEKTGNLRTLHIKEASGYKLQCMIYYIDKGCLLAVYANGEKRIRVLSYIKNELSTNSAQKETESEATLAIKGRLTISNKTIDIRAFKNNSGVYKSGGKIDTTNSLTRIDFSEQILEYQTMEQNIVETTLNELMQQKQVK